MGPDSGPSQLSRTVTVRLGQRSARPGRVNPSGLVDHATRPDASPSRPRQHIGAASVLGHAPTTPTHSSSPQPVPPPIRSVAARPRAREIQTRRRRRAPTGSLPTRQDEPVGRRRRGGGGSRGHGGVFLGRPSQAGDPPLESRARFLSLCLQSRECFRSRSCG